MKTEFIKADLERIIGTRPMHDGGTMPEVLARLDACAQSSRIPERLKHYLSKRSYVKALAWIEDPNIPHQL
jgi:hypothetical protein